VIESKECGDSWFYYRELGTCYLSGPGLMTGTISSAICKEYGGTLLTLDTSSSGRADAELRFVLGG